MAIRMRYTTLCHRIILLLLNNAFQRGGEFNPFGLLISLGQHLFSVNRAKHSTERRLQTGLYNDDKIIPLFKLFICVSSVVICLEDLKRGHGLRFASILVVPKRQKWVQRGF